MANRPDAAALFAGRIDDGGFMAAGWHGLVRARDELGLRVEIATDVEPVAADLAAALRTLARTGAPLIVAHGGQNSAAIRTVAQEFPGQHFAITQSDTTGTNLAAYEVLQEQSAYLAGAAAGLLTRTGVVGHISGIRVRPGLKGRAAYAAGVRATNSSARLLTTFCGAQDDVEVARATAAAQARAGADVVFTMLNAGITGAIDAFARHGVRQIGNVRDWVAERPDVFVGSAMADVGLGVLAACRDHRSGAWLGGRAWRIGLEDPAAVRLLLAPDVPVQVRTAVDTIARAIVAGTTIVPEDYDGPEFDVATAR
jgi:basic membrane protein A